MAENGNPYQFFASSDPDIHPFADEAKAFAEMFQEWLQAHDDDVHDGERCWDERIGMICFLCHKWGISSARFFVETGRFLEILTWYEDQHHASHG